MKYYSTNRSVSPSSFREAVLKGLPEDNGLYMPEFIPALPQDFLSTLNQKSLAEIGFAVARPFVEEDIPADKLWTIVEETLNFPIPVVEVHDSVFSLELFHGPTCAFKDVGARFLARCLGYFSDEKVTVLVATSGDTGSAVANGFLGIKNVDVVILYPKDKVSHLQEQQLTTLGQNITAIEVSGTFDDCQQMVKKAFLDKELNKKINITSANSINIARLLPQTFYYFWAISQIRNTDDVFVSVPSGNYGNLSAGLLAKAMGLKIKRFIASSNINNIVPLFLSTGKFEPRPSKQTISNAMDVGNPSNFGRMIALYGNSLENLTQDVSGFSFDDQETRNIIQEVYQKYGYTLDPHGAVGYLGLREHLKNKRATGIFLETAHPAKFIESMRQSIGEVEIPQRLKDHLHKEKKSIEMGNDFKELKSYLIDSSGT